LRGNAFNLKPFEKLKQVTVFDLDDIKCMPMVLTVGYRYLPSSAQPAIQRFQPIVLLHIPFPGRTLLTDRNRADLDWSNGSFHWTYRNRITAELRVTIHSYHPGPYAAAEFAYQSQFSKWSITRLFAGCLLPLTGHIQLDIYYEHVNNTSLQPNNQVTSSAPSSISISRRPNADSLPIVRTDYSPKAHQVRAKAYGQKTRMD
jgi:hypothetical protein